jgi:hypothetical protein
MGGWLLQSLDNSSQESWKIVTKASVSDALKKDLEFAWTVVKHVRSNAIVIAEKGVAIGIGGGQTSRVDAVEIALKRSEGKRGRNCVLASDAFFPFRDNIDLLKDKNITLEVTNEVKDYLAELGYSPDFGARPLKRVIYKEVQVPLSKKILDGSFSDGDKITATLIKHHEHSEIRFDKIAIA